MNNLKNALYAGSFNPINLRAHINFKKACEIFNTVYVLVSQNPDKEKWYN
ncbi:hypothetical protein NW069_04730 [Mycoplasmopsis cynos]|nr:hypothetical protein [Mycoplasmopsis cynos]UWV80580.1 hypothetical protein NW069_04730 [Mycoplasmopsis cynos]